MSFQSALRPIPRASTACKKCLFRVRNQPSRKSSSPPISPQHRSLSNVSGLKSDDNAQNVPRWAATPSAMRAPYRLRPKSDNDEYPVNDNPERLDEAYVRMLGKGADGWLDESIKWLAVTHKSFDHGRRGFNERLAFLGKRMVYLQTSYALLNSAPAATVAEARKRKDAYGRYPFQDEALKGIESVSHYSKEQILDERRLSQLATKYGLADVVRWKPRQIRDLKTSGLDAVLTTTMYAVIGAVALQRGGEVANQMIRQRILAPLGAIS